MRTLTTRAARPANVIYEWLTTVDHKKIGLMYIVYALIFLIVAGVEAMLMRIQLAVPNNHFVSPAGFQSAVHHARHDDDFLCRHAGFVRFGQLSCAADDRRAGYGLSAAQRIQLLGLGVRGLMLYFSYVGASGLYAAGTAPDVGWFAYAPLTAKVFSPGHSTDYWTLSIFLSGIGSIGTALNLATTILCMRCKGMKMSRMPLLVWLYLTMSGLVFVTISPLTAAQVMLTFDRYLGSHFFDTQAGGSAVLWMHFFWIFGHPEVYVLILPSFAFVNEIVPVFSRKAIFGYPAMVAASVGIGFISLSVWAHHMFTVGMDAAANTFFVFATMVISVPTGIKIFNWLATIWGGKVIFATPMMFCVAFLFQFLIAGLTGIMLAVAPFDWQLGNSYFVVAHFHYVIVGGILFALFAAFYYWYPKVTGKMISETLGKWHFWLFVIGFHLTFDFMHIPGILGMPRRIYTYEASRGWGTLNMIVSIGGAVQAIALLIFVYNLVRFLLRRARRPATIRGTRGRSSGRRPLHRRTITSPCCPRSTAAGRCGT